MNFLIFNLSQLQLYLLEKDLLHAATLDGFTYIEDVLNIPLSNSSTFVANNCGYTGKTHDLIVN